MSSLTHGTEVSGMSPEDIGALFTERFGEKALEVEVAYGQVTVTLEPDALVDAARMCKDDEALDCAFWEFNCPVDLGEDGFALVVGLYSIRFRHRVFLRIVVPGGRDNPVAPSLTGVYRGANWSEREAYDMFGIEFEGHPQLLPRILTVENFEGWPLRKEFLLSTREAKPWPGAKEPEEKKDDAAGESAAVAADATPVSAEDKANAAKAKAERAKAKAAEARKRKAAERAAAEGTAPAAEGAGGADADPEATDERAAAASAAGADVPEGTPDATSHEGAAEVADSAIAKDAEAGAVGGDVAAGAPGDAPGAEEPVEDLEQEAEQGEGGAPSASGTPGIEAEGRHVGADEQSGSKPAAETPGMTADPAGGAGAPAQTQAPTPDGDDDRPTGQPASATMGEPSSPGGSAPDEPETGTVELEERRKEGIGDAPPPDDAGRRQEGDGS